MDIHKNARLTPRGREHMVNLVIGGQTPEAVAAAVGVCPRTVRKWLRRFREEGLAGLQDRSARPQPATASCFLTKASATCCNVLTVSCSAAPRNA